MKKALGGGLAGLILGCWLVIGPAGVQAKSPAPAEKSAAAKKAPRASAQAAVAKNTAKARATASSRSAATRKSAKAKSSPKRASAKPASAHTVSVKRTTRDAPARPSLGQSMGLHAASDALDLRSSVALVTDAVTGEILYEKNAFAVLPIASITKLMTAIVVLDSQASMNEMLTITQADVDTERGSRSRLPAGTRLSRAELLQLALMSSENRAAHALGRHHPQGYRAFVDAMNARARSLGMRDTTFVEPTGLSSANASNARDLAKLVRAAAGYPLIREYSTAPELTVDSGYRQHAFRNTNRLISSEGWDIELQKTGYISEAGRCLVMQVQLDGRQIVLVLLDSTGRYSRFGDAQRVRVWLESTDRRSPARTISQAMPALSENS